MLSGWSPGETPRLCMPACVTDLKRCQRAKDCPALAPPGEPDTSVKQEAGNQHSWGRSWPGLWPQAGAPRELAQRRSEKAPHPCPSPSGVTPPEEGSVTGTEPQPRGQSFSQTHAITTQGPPHCLAAPVILAPGGQDAPGNWHCQCYRRWTGWNTGQRGSTQRGPAETRAP